MANSEMKWISKLSGSRVTIRYTHNFSFRGDEESKKKRARRRGEYLLVGDDVLWWGTETAGAAAMLPRSFLVQFESQLHFPPPKKLKSALSYNLPFDI